MQDLISRQAAIDALDGEIEITGRTNVEAVKGYVRLVKDRLERLPSAQSDNRLSKIAELVEGTIDHFDLDDAMDLLYQIKEVLDGSDDLPSAQPEPQWIPCSEKLPEAPGFVNCTCHSLIDNREDWVVETFYMPQPSGSPYSDWGNIPMLNDGKCEVVAWMYRNIPEPYKAETERKEHE